MSTEKDQDQEIIKNSNAYAFDFSTATDEIMNEISDIATDYAIYKGIAIRSRNLHRDVRVAVPFCLIPSPFPEKEFNHVKRIQPIMNNILHRIAHDKEFLYSCLKNTIKIDSFTANIWKIYEAIEDEDDELMEQISLGLLRSDYMLDTDPDGTVTGIKQIESNVIATSFSGLASSTTQLHKFVLDRLGLKEKIPKLPDNTAFYDMAKGIVAAWDLYGKKSAWILVVVEDTTYNICDQRATEFAVCEIENNIRIMRRTFTKLRTAATLDGRTLFVDGKEIAVVYYRHGYTPEAYEPEDWDVRLLMERSRAIKCPSVGYHLAGTKRVQLQLSAPGVLEKFLPDEVDPAEIMQVFARQYSLDMNEEGDKAVLQGIMHPEKYVMKPEREGGGNNVYGEEVSKLLESLRSSEDRMIYILMDKINPPLVNNCIVRAETVPKITKIISELGIYGVIIGTKSRILKNYEAGHVIRSKEVGMNEGGIAAGYGALDSPYLI